jgi:hypothetical protein
MNRPGSAKLIEAVGSLPARQLRLVEEASDLTSDEVEVIRRATERFPVELRDLLAALLDSWPTMAVPERTAGLLTLAAALARLER